MVLNSVDKPRVAPISSSTFKTPETVKDYFVFFLNKVIYFSTWASLLLHGQSVGETIPCLLGLKLLRLKK